jgi:hypothetical protein
MDPTPDDPGDQVTVVLTLDEGLVLDAYLARGQEAGDDYSSFEDQAELRVLWDLAAMIERQLPVVNIGVDKYTELLASARARVRDSTE